jgi:hypothetical protein
MARSKSRAVAATLGVCALIGASVPALTMAAGVEKAIIDRLRLLSEGLVMGGTANPTPDTPYFDATVNTYLEPRFPSIPFADYHALPTPEQFCPFVCLAPGTEPGGPPPFPLPSPLDPNDYPPNLTFGSSLFTEAGILNQAVRSPAGLDNLQPGNDLVVSGYSQSASVASVSMNDLIQNAEAGTAGWPTLSKLSNLHVVLTGDPNSPIGGILDRFQFPDTVAPFSLTPAMQHVPFVNIPLGTAPTPTTDIPSTVITGEYDGFGNFPQDPLNILADINALIGIATVHPYYSGYAPDQLADNINVGTIGTSNFEFIPENLPILQFMYNDSTTAGQFFGDFFSPYTRLFIDWGYGNAGDPGDSLTPTSAGGSAIDGLYAIPTAVSTNGANIAGSPYESSVGVAGGPWTAGPTGALYDGSAFTSVADSGIAGLFEKMDPLQMLAGLENAVIQSVVGPGLGEFYRS